MEHEERPLLLRVLIVDDCRDTCASLGVLLKHWGFDARVAHDGATALAVEEQFRPQVILLDIGLPDIGGVEVARRLRERRGRSWPFVACTSGWGDRATREQAREGGCDAFLLKPVDPEAIRFLLRSLAAACRHGGETPAP